MGEKQTRNGETLKFFSHKGKLLSFTGQKCKEWISCNTKRELIGTVGMVGEHSPGTLWLPEIEPKKIPRLSSPLPCVFVVSFSFAKPIQNPKNKEI